MEGQADREILFTLTPVVADNAGQVFDDFANKAEKAYEDINAIAHESSRWCQETAAEAAIKMAEEYQAGAKLSTEALRNAAKEQQQILRRSLTMPEQVQQTQSRPTRPGAGSPDKADVQMNREAERLRKEIETSRLRDLAPDQRYNEELARSQKLLAANKITAVEYAQAAAVAQEKRETAVRKASDVAQKAADQEQKARDRQAKEEERAHARAVSTVEQARARMTSGQMALVEGFKQTISGVTAFARSVALFGVTSEKDMEKAVKMLAKMEGQIQAVRGAVDLVQGGIKMWRAYTATIEAATAAHQALAAAQAMSAGTTATAAASGVAGVGATGAAGAVGSIGGRAAAGAATGVVGAIASLPAAIAAAIVGTIAGGAMAFNIGGARDKTAGAIAGSGWVDPDTMGGWLFSTGYGWGTGTSGSELRKRALDSQKKTDEMQTGREFHLTQAERVTAEAELNNRQRNAEDEAARRQRLAEAQAPIQDKYREARASATEDIHKRQAELEKTRPDLWDTEENKAKYAMEGSRLTMEAEQKQRQLEAEAGRESAAEGYRLAQEEAEKARQEAEAVRSRQLGPQATASDRAQLDADLASSGQRDLAAQERLAQANQERLNQEERIKQVRIQAAEESISKTQEEINMRQQLIDQEKQRLMSAKERIASMNEGEQAEYARVLQKARSGQELTAQEFQQLGSINTEETERLKREQAEKRSKAFMDKTGVADIENERINRMEKEKESLQVTLKDQRDLRVTIERDDSKLLSDVGAEIRRQMEERDRKFIELVKQENERTRQDIYNRISQRNSQR